MSDLVASTDRIDLWLTFCQDCDARSCAEYRGLLSDEERRTEARFRFERDRRRYVVTRALVRTVLSRYASTPPTAWRFRANAYGRPEIANQGDAERALSFNVSHTTDLILFGVTREEPLGVDIEAVRKNVSMGIADRFFSRDEVAGLSVVPADLRVDRFFELWTLKESYIKARGLGLSMPLDSFAFDLSCRSRIRFSLVTPSTDANEAWRFWQLRPSTEHVAAVCVRHRQRRKETLSLRKLVPLGAEVELGCSVHRQSHTID